QIQVRGEHVELAVEILLQVRAGRTCAFDLRARGKLPADLSLAVGLKGVHQRRQRYGLRIERHVIAISGHAQVEVRSGIDRRSVEGELTGLEDNAAAVDQRRRLQLREVHFAQAQAADVHVAGEILERKFDR